MVVAGAYDLSPTRKGHTNDKSPLWRRHTMSDWHRSTFGEESNYVKPGKIIVDRPLRTLATDSRAHSSSICTSMSMTFSDRIITPELMVPHIITNKSAKPPRHLDPRIRGWDLNTSVWWPSVLQHVNARPTSGDRERPASGSSAPQKSARQGQTTSGSSAPQKSARQPRKRRAMRDAQGRAVSAPLPVLRTPLGFSVSPHSRTAALRRNVEHLHKGSHLTVSDSWGRAGAADLHYAHFHGSDSRPVTRLIYDLPHADQGADREFTYNVGHTVGPSTLILENSQVP